MPYCNTEFEVEALKSYGVDLQSEPQDNMKWDNQPGNQWKVDETTGLHTYVCESCGGGKF